MLNEREYGMGWDYISRNGMERVGVGLRWGDVVWLWYWMGWNRIREYKMKPSQVTESG